MIPGSERDHPTLWRSFGFAIQGFRLAITSEHNLKIMAGAAFGVIVLGFVVGLDAIRWAIILVCCGIVIAAELLNTALETIVDLVSPEFHPLAGRAKDIGAAAVWVLCLCVAVVGIIVFASKWLGW